jgi:DNA-binding NarL/FixJ family response regulator
MPTLIDHLTKREWDVWRGLVMGLPNKEIAILLGIREQTVRNHLYSIYNKLLPNRRGGERSKRYRLRLAIRAQEGIREMDHADID